MGQPPEPDDSDSSDEDADVPRTSVSLRQQVNVLTSDMAEVKKQLELIAGALQVNAVPRGSTQSSVDDRDGAASSTSESPDTLCIAGDNAGITSVTPPGALRSELY